MSIYSVCVSKKLIFTTRNGEHLLDYNDDVQCEEVSVTILKSLIQETLSGSGYSPELVFLIGSSDISLEGNVTQLSDLNKKMFVIDTGQQGQNANIWKGLATNKNHFALLEDSANLMNNIKEGN